VSELNDIQIASQGKSANFYDTSFMCKQDGLNRAAHLCQRDETSGCALVIKRLKNVVANKRSGLVGRRMILEIGHSQSEIELVNCAVAHADYRHSFAARALADRTAGLVAQMKLDGPSARAEFLSYGASVRRSVKDFP